MPTNSQILRLRIDNINSAHVKLNIFSFQDIINYHKNRGGGYEGLNPHPLQCYSKEIDIIKAIEMAVETVL